MKMQEPRIFTSLLLCPDWINDQRFFRRRASCALSVGDRSGLIMKDLSSLFLLERTLDLETSAALLNFTRSGRRRSAFSGYLPSRRESLIDITVGAGGGGLGGWGDYSPSNILGRLFIILRELRMREIYVSDETGQRHTNIFLYRMGRHKDRLEP